MNEIVDEETPKRGFVTLGIDTGDDLIRFSYAMACSLKTCDPTASVTLIVDKGKLDNVPKVYEHAFDYIVELPYGNSAHKDGFHGMNLWQIYYASPYQETIYVDYDTLFVNTDINDLWDVMSVTKEISVPKRALSYRNFPTPPMWRFEFEIQYDLPTNFYNLIYWHKESLQAREWFKMCDPVFQHWRSIYTKQFPDKKPDRFEKNLLGNVVTAYVDLTNEIGVNLNNHYDLHRYSHGSFPVFEEIPLSWTEQLNYWVTDNRKIQIENSIIGSGIIHYSDENFISDEILDVFRTSFIKRIQER
tara:strand:- start:1424 stop:2329 length:906 start_codon:yes stop_codon:yes gene_type:complete